MTLSSWVNKFKTTAQSAIEQAVKVVQSAAKVAKVVNAVTQNIVELVQGSQTEQPGSGPSPVAADQPVPVSGESKPSGEKTVSPDEEIPIDLEEHWLTNIPILSDIGELVSDFVFNAVDEIEGVTEAAARSIQTAKAYETELVQAVVNATSSAADALHLLFADIPSDISEDDAQKLLEGNGTVLISNDSPDWGLGFQQQGEDPNECATFWQKIHGNKPVPPISLSDFCYGQIEDDTHAPIIVFFGGSDGSNLYNVGPNPANQTPAWVQIPGYDVHVYQYPGVPQPNDSLTWFNAAHYDPTNPDTWIRGTQYDPNAPSGKRGQAALAVGYENSDILVIGYSAGADAALMFADQYLKNQQDNGGTGRITGGAILGGTMTGTMPDGTSSLEDEWPRIVGDLLNTGAEVYVLDDKAADGGDARSYSNASSPGVFLFDGRSGQFPDDPPGQEHWDGALSGQFGIGTNNSIEYRDFVLNWFGSHE